MTYFVIEGYDSLGDYSFLVVAKDKVEARQAMDYEIDDRGGDIQLSRIYGPFELAEGKVVTMRSPS